jgi:hypothetical protein
MFAVTAIVDYHPSVADQGKQTSVFHFWLVTNSSLSFPFSVYTYMRTSAYCIYIHMENGTMYIYIHMLPFQTENGKRKSRRFILSCTPFAHYANGSFSFVRLLAKKQMEVFCLQTGLPICANLQYLKTLLDNLELLDASE